MASLVCEMGGCQHILGMLVVASSCCTVQESYACLIVASDGTGSDALSLAVAQCSHTPPFKPVSASAPTRAASLLESHSIYLLIAPPCHRSLRWKSWTPRLDSEQRVRSEHRVRCVKRLQIKIYNQIMRSVLTATLIHDLLVVIAWLLHARGDLLQVQVQ